jgi:hypothetical protein
MKAPTNKVPANLSIDAEVKAEAIHLAENNGENLSELVERLLVREIVKPTHAPKPLEIARALAMAEERSPEYGTGETTRNFLLDSHSKQVAQPATPMPDLKLVKPAKKRA